MAYQLGQPVDSGHRAGVPVSALRLCMSARLVVQAARDPDQERHLIGQALACLDMVSTLVHFPTRDVGVAPVLDTAFS